MALSAVIATFMMAMAVVIASIVATLMMAVVTASIVLPLVVMAAVVTPAVVLTLVVTAPVLTALVVLMVIVTAALLTCSALLTQEACTCASERAARSLGRIHLPQRRRVDRLARVAFASALLAKRVCKVVRRKLLGRLTGARHVTVLPGASDQQGRSEHAAKSRESG
jgi:hypothetical protein